MSNPAQIFHFDLYGKREDKYNFLNENSLQSIPFTELKPQEPELFFVPKNFEIKSIYDEGFAVNELFTKSSVGVQTHRDELVIDFSKENLNNRLNELFTTDNLKLFARKYEVKESNFWSLDIAIKKEVDLKSELFRKITYRPFDERDIYYSDNFVDRTRKNVGKEIVKENLVLNFPKIVKVNWSHSLISKSIPTAISMDINGTYFAPLYIYPEKNKSALDFEGAETPERIPNLNPEILKKTEESLQMTFIADDNLAKIVDGKFTPLDLLDYIYAVLHSPKYRETYKEFLKIDFPRVPFPTKETFWQLVKLGSEIRKLHLLEEISNKDLQTKFPISGDNVVAKPSFVKTENQFGKVYINEIQYFENIPEIAWNFYIGGYQPAQKWLKDRKERELNFEDIMHYQKIIFALQKTDELMKKIDEVFVF